MSKPFSWKRQCYSMESVDGSNVEINMYGDVCETRPIDWWTDEPIEGNFIVQDEFLADLEKLSKSSSVTFRINSYGGDTVVGLLIHNRIRDLAHSGVKTTCIVDGVAMSAASIIMCACDDVVVNPTSLVMVHKCWTPLWGGYNADDLRSQAQTLDEYDKAICAAYARKTGLSETVLGHMMADTTYMTGKEAVEKGFANRLAEDAEDISIAASADGRSLYVNGRKTHLTPGMFAPDFIPTIEASEVSVSDEPINNEPSSDGENEGGFNMTLDELRTQHPELVEQIEAAARASVDVAAARASAVRAEQDRLRAIDEVAALFDDELVAEARYGENACNAQELSYRAAQRAAAQGRQFLANLAGDTDESNASDVPAVPGAIEEMTGDTPESIEAAAKMAVENFKKFKEAK